MKFPRMSARKLYPANPELFAWVADTLRSGFPVNKFNVLTNDQCIRVVHEGIVHEIQIRALTTNIEKAHAL